MRQAQRLCLTSRAFYNDCLGPYEKWPRNSSAMTSCSHELRSRGCRDGTETGPQMGLHKKGIPENEALIITCEGNFHGRTITIVSISTDPDSYSQYGPFTPGFISIPYDDSEALRKVLEEKGDRVAAFLAEPIQGEAGVYVPHDGYLTRVL